MGKGEGGGGRGVGGCEGRMEGGLLFCSLLTAWAIYILIPEYVTVLCLAFRVLQNSSMLSIPLISNRKLTKNKLCYGDPAQHLMFIAMGYAGEKAREIWSTLLLFLWLLLSFAHSLHVCSKCYANIHHTFAHMPLL